MTSAAQRLIPKDFAESSDLFRVVDEALDVLDEERAVFLNGNYDRIPDIGQRKLAVLERLEAVLPSVPRSATVINAMKRLIAASRRNEQIIQAARQGLAHARRRISAIRDTGRGMVAYAEDGSRIASHADMIGTGKSA